MENLCLQFSKHRKLNTQKSFKHSHALMLKRNLRRVMGKTEPTENSCLWFPSVDRISVSAIMKKLKNGCHFVNINHTEKFHITNPPKVWVSSFPSVKRNRISVLAIMKNLKNGCHFVNIDHTEKFQTTNSPKVLVFGFLSVNRNGISESAIMKKLKNGCYFVNIEHMENFQITDPHKVWVFGFLSVNRNRISASAIMKKLNMATILLICILLILVIQKKFKLLTPQSLGLWFSECRHKWNISIGHYQKN